MIDKKRGYYRDRPFYSVDTNVNISAGMVAFLTTDASGVVVATTAASGDVPVGTFWKDADSTWRRTTVESATFSDSGTINLSGGNVASSSDIKVTNSAGTTTYTQGTDYTVSLTNGVVTRVAGGSIAAEASVVVWYAYTLSAAAVAWDKAGTRDTRGVNYDRQPDDTLGSSQITVVEGDAKIYTDQYDPTQTYTLNAALTWDSDSRWTSDTSSGNTVCGRVIKVPTASDPFLGLDQIRVTA